MKQFEERFLLLKSLCKLFSTSARPLGGGFSSLVVDMGDGTVSKFYQPNHCGVEKNKQQLLNEERILKTFNGHVGNFTTPLLTGDAVIFENHHPAAAHFIGFIPMTKLEGRVLEWDDLHHSLTPLELTTYFQETGSLLASIQDTIAGISIPPLHATTPFQIVVPWVTDPEMMQMVNCCNKWFEKHQQEGFVHNDLYGRNMMVDKNNHVNGVMDFSLSTSSSNHLRDFAHITGDKLPPAISGYESTSGKKLDRALIEMTQIQSLGVYISGLQNAVGAEKEYAKCKVDFEGWVRSIIKDLALQ